MIDKGAIVTALRERFAKDFSPIKIKFLEQGVVEVTHNYPNSIGGWSYSLSSTDLHPE